MADRSHSELPDDPQYWRDLAGRIRADAEGPLARYAAADETWFEVLGQRVAWWVAATAAVVATLWLVQPTADPAAVVTAWIEASLGIDEPAVRLVAGPEAPALDELLASLAYAAERRP